MTDRLFIGVMSGTSCDGADAALVRVGGRGPAMRAAFLHLASVDYTDADRRRIAAARDGALDVGGLAGLSAIVAERYAAAVHAVLNETGTPPADVTAVAAHGQTLFHAPPLTYQAFDPTHLAAAVGIDVVSDFRRADCRANGQGAPLVPFGDWVMFRDATTPRVLLNLGGIANVTLLPAGGALADVRGMDVGPANCLSDWLMRDQGGVDAGGRLAATGRVIEPVARAMRADPFFAARGPKSTDTPYMIRGFAAALTRTPAASLADRLATANHVVATAVLDAIAGETAADAGPVECFVAGGGVFNADLMRRLAGGPAVVRTTDALGVPAQAREAAAFALLAAAHVDRFAAFMPKVTGATRPAILGSLTPALVPSPGTPGEGQGGAPNVG